MSKVGENKQQSFFPTDNKRKWYKMAFVGVKFDNFNKKLIEIHKQDEAILAKYGIAVDIEDDECFNCGAEKLNFFYSKTNKE